MVQLILASNKSKWIIVSSESGSSQICCRVRFLDAVVWPSVLEGKNVLLIR